MLSIRNIPVLALLILFLPGIIQAQQADYEDIFGDDWTGAEAFERENRNWMESRLEQNGIPYRVAIAVVFPELVRYSALRDKMETTLLKALYVNLGDEYANFSIGHFQIKPSFASLIRTEAPKSLERKSGIVFSQPEDFNDISNYRKSIIIDLEDPKTQFNYIVAFFKICEKKFRTGRMDEYEKIKFFSTAYNYGIDKSPEEIRSMIDKKFFSTKIFKTITYCYSDISLYWYKQKTIF